MFTLSQKHEAKENRKWINQEKKAMAIKTMGHGRDNIYQFKLYCSVMRQLLESAQAEGIGIGENRDESFYDKHKAEISKKYCNDRDPQKWCMRKVELILEKERYINSWFAEGFDDEEARIMQSPYDVQTAGTYNNLWCVYPSEYDFTRSVGAMKQLKNVKLPKDGKTNGEKILRALYIYNHATTFNLTPYENDISFYINAKPNIRYDKSVPYFEESGITLYN